MFPYVSRFDFRVTPEQIDAQKAALLRMTMLGWTRKELAVRAGVSADTVGPFLLHQTWGQGKTRRALSVALGWPEDRLDILGAGGDVGPAREALGSMDNADPTAYSDLDAKARDALLKRLRAIDANAEAERAEAINDAYRN